MQGKPGNGEPKPAVCKNCGKQIGPSNTGSITSWLFKESCCQCDKRQEESLTGIDNSQAVALMEHNCAGPADIGLSSPSSNAGPADIGLRNPGQFASASSNNGPSYSGSGTGQNHPQAPPTPPDERQYIEMPIQAIARKRNMTESNMASQTLSENFSASSSSVASAPVSAPGEAPHPVSRLPAHAPARFGERYEMIELVGEGGMATVYKVRDLVLNQFFAIKIIHPELAKDELRRRRFEQEATTARALNHANIVTIYAFDISPEGVPYLIMDYVEGRNLGQVIGEKPLELGNFYDHFIQVCSALAHAHSRGVIHRDIKPSNILVTNLSASVTWIKLADFGIAKMIMHAGGDTSDLTRTGDFLGSPYYVSPEQAQGEDVDQRSDIYSLGCVMFHALTGRAPFTAASPVKIILQHINNPPPKLVSLSAETLPVGLERIIHRCLEKRPEDRYQNAFDLRTDLQLLQEGKEPQMRLNVNEQAHNEINDLLDLSKEKTNLNTVFDGALSYDMRLNNVLERIIELGIPGDTLLRLESTSPEFAGLVVIRDGYQVLGAKILKQPIHGYEAFRKMISMADGKFRYQSILCTDYRLPDLSLQLNLNYILFLYPSIPESPSELLDQAALRDLVFAVQDDSTFQSSITADATAGGTGERTAEIPGPTFDEEDEKWVAIGQIEPEKPQTNFPKAGQSAPVEPEVHQPVEKVAPKLRGYVKPVRVRPEVAMSVMAFIFLCCVLYLAANILTKNEAPSAAPAQEPEQIIREAPKKADPAVKPSTKKRKKKSSRKRS